MNGLQQRNIHILKLYTELMQQKHKTLFLMLVKTIREGNLNIYTESLQQMVPTMLHMHQKITVEGYLYLCNL